MTPKLEKRIDDAMMECYRRLFAQSTPTGDFDKMFEEAEINEFHQKVIPFMDYELEESKWDPIFLDIIKEFKIPKRYDGMFRRSILLGCSPKTKMGC